MALDWSSWMSVAESHLRGARNALETDDFLIVVQMSHQIAEESLKALWVFRSAELVPRVHNLVELAEGVAAPANITRLCRYLTPLYALSRYPDAANTNPVTMFERDSAEEALEAAETVFYWCVAGTRSESESEGGDGA